MFTLNPCRPMYSLNPDDTPESNIYTIPPILTTQKFHSSVLDSLQLSLEPGTKLRESTPSHLDISQKCGIRTSNVVEAAGQPTPGPFKFCNVTSEAWILAALDAFELSVGNDTGTLGLLIAWPAATFWLNAYAYGYPNQELASNVSFILEWRRDALRTWMNELRSGGQEQGIFTT
jgi:hypothetical protein